MDAPDSSSIHLAALYLIIVCGASLALLVLVAIAARRLLQSSRSAKEARSSLDPAAELGRGSATVAGRLEYGNEASSAVTVEIVQRGSQYYDKEEACVCNHTWQEVDRSVNATPFYLRLETGKRIRVEPGENPLVVGPLADFAYVDDPEPEVYVNGAERVRVAVLDSGTHVIAQGVLHWDADPEAMLWSYRAPPMGWVLRPPAQEPMHLFSDPLEDRLLHWQRFYRSALGWLLATFIVVQLALVPIHRDVWLGQICHAQIEVVAWELVFIVCTVSCLFALSAALGRPWYEGSKVNDSGTGRLDPTTGL